MCAHGLPDGSVAARDVVRITVDSGACDAIVPPSIFQHTPAIKHEEFGRTYAACGGETVTNLGVKNVQCLLSSGDIKSIPFQVGDKVTRGLLAVSKLAELGAGVWFGPAPKYDSHIVWDKQAFVAASGPKQELEISNGTYILPIREVFNKSSINAVEAEEAQDESMPPDWRRAGLWKRELR